MEQEEETVSKKRKGIFELPDDHQLTLLTVPYDINEDVLCSDFFKRIILDFHGPDFLEEKQIPALAGLSGLTFMIANSINNIARKMVVGDEVKYVTAVKKFEFSVEISLNNSPVNNEHIQTQRRLLLQYIIAEAKRLTDENKESESTAQAIYKVSAEECGSEGA